MAKARLGDRDTVWCPIASASATKLEIVKSNLVTTQGPIPKTVTFEDGSTMKQMDVTPGAETPLSFSMWLSQGEYFPRDAIGAEVTLKVTLVDSGYYVEEPLWIPFSYTYDTNPTEGVAKWTAISPGMSGGGVGHQVSIANGAYPGNQDSYLRRKIDLADASTASTSFVLWMDVQKQNDYLTLEVSTNEQTWTTLRTYSLNLSSGDPGAGQWVRDSVDLAAYLGGQYFMQFRFHSDASISGQGVRLDGWTVDLHTTETTESDFAAGGYDPAVVSVEGGTVTTINGGSGYPSTATFASFPTQVGWAQGYLGISFAAEVLENTAVQFQVRSAASSADLLNAPWVGPTGSSTAFFDSDAWTPLCFATGAGDRWLQYRIEFLSWDTEHTASVTQVEWTYTGSL